VQYEGEDLLLHRPARWALGTHVDDDGSWAWAESAAASGYADPTRPYTVAHVTRRLAHFDRVEALADAVNRVIEDQRPPAATWRRPVRRRNNRPVG
jgi:hypothetical protein